MFALLESGCKEVYLVKDSVYGIEASDPPTAIEDVKRWSNVDYHRRLAYSGEYATHYPRFHSLSGIRDHHHPGHPLHGQRVEVVQLGPGSIPTSS